MGNLDMSESIYWGGMSW